MTRLDTVSDLIVAAGPGAPVLTTLVSVSPIYASFDADEQVVARALRERNVGRVRFLLDDPALLADVTERTNVPDALVLAYVRLRCALNQFRDVRFALAPSGDLAQRARAEVALHVAA